jgi:hypothetical protein
LKRLSASLRAEAILVVEDEPFIRMAIADQLREAGSARQANAAYVNHDNDRLPMFNKKRDIAHPTGTVTLLA